MSRRMILGAVLAVLVVALGNGSQPARAGGPRASHTSTNTAAAGGSAVTGSGTAGQMSRWVGYAGGSYVLGNSNITEDKFGKIGIGTTTPTSALTVNGIVETSTGIKFPDGSVQTTGALSSIAHDATLAGNGTPASPLGIAAGQVVRSINGMTDDLTLAAGANITLTPVGNTITIAAAGAGSNGGAAFQGSFELTWSDGNGIANGSLTIPAGKRLVIEYITITASLISGQTLVDTLVSPVLDGNVVDYRIAVPSNPSYPTSPFAYAVDKQVRIYADDLYASASRTPTNSSGHMTISVSGYLVDLP